MPLHKHNLDLKIFVIIGLFLSSCTPSQAAIQTALVKTQTAATNTPLPTITPLPSATPESMWAHCIPGNTMTKQYFNQLLQQQTCIYGIITKKDVSDSGDTVYNIYPLDKQFPYLILVWEYKKLQEALPGAKGILTTADVGDCIVVVGFPTQPDNGGAYLFGFDVRDVPQLAAELGVSNPIIQEINTLCK